MAAIEKQTAIKPDEKPKPSYAAPVKREKNRAWRDDERHDQRDRDGKITGPAFHRRDMKSGRQSRAKSEAEK